MTAVSKLENGGETLSWLWSRKVSKQGFSFENMYDTIYPEQNSTSQPAMGNRTQRRQQRSPGLPLGTSLRCPTLSNSPGKLREFLEHSKLVPPLKWPQGAHATMSSYIMLYKHPNHWHVFKSSWRQIQSKPPALTPTTQQSRTAEKNSCSTILHPRRLQLFSKPRHWYNFHCSTGYARTFLAACVLCAAGRWIQPKYSSIHRKPVTQTQKLSEKIAEGETSLLDSWTLGQVLLSSSTGLKEHLQCHIFLMPKLDTLMHVQTNTAWTDTRHWLSWPCLQRNIICCPIFELPDWMRCILPFRVLLCHDAPFDTIRMAHRGTIVPGMIMLPILPTTSWNRLRWLRCHCLQRFVAKRFSSWLRMIEDSPCRWGNKWKSFKNYPTGFQLKMHKCMKTLAKIKKVKT